MYNHKTEQVPTIKQTVTATMKEFVTDLVPSIVQTVTATMKEFVKCCSEVKFHWVVVGGAVCRTFSCSPEPMTATVKDANSSEKGRTFKAKENE
jgi:hypothetical protein